MRSAATILPPAPEARATESPFKGDGLRRLVQRRYELRLVERHLWSRPNTSTVVHDDEEEGDEGGSPHVDRLPEMTPELREEIETWLSRVVLVDGDRRFPVRSLGRDGVNAWRRAGGERPLPSIRYLNVAETPAESPVEVAAERTFPRFPPPAVTARPTASPAIEPARREDSKMGELTGRMKQIADTIDLPPREVSEKFGMTVNAVYTARSSLKKKGLLGGGPAPKKPAAARPARKGGGRTPDVLVATVTQTDDELIAPLRAALEAHDAKRTRLVGAIVALGGEA